MAADRGIQIISLNCNGYKSNFVYTDTIIKNNDCIHLSETWITQSESHLLHRYKNDFNLTICPAKRHEHGRPFGGTVLLLRKKKFTTIDKIFQEDHLTCIKATFNNRQLLLMVYLQPTSSNSSYVDIYKTSFRQSLAS